MHKGGTGMDSFQLFITAAEAYPALERAFLAARIRISASFLVFDPDTALRSAEGLAVGRTWLDLIRHCLAKGVQITFVISDFDPIARAQMHRATWRSLRQMIAAAEMAGAGHLLTIRAARHPAVSGWIPRLIISPVIMMKLWKTARWLNRLPPDLRATALRDMPGVARRMRALAGGRVRPRLWPVPRLFPGTHHQKLAVFDGQSLYIGGLDLNERRYDDARHQRPADETWHDVQVLVSGPVAADAQRHLDSFLEITSGQMPPAGTGNLIVTLSRAQRNPAVPFGPKPLVQGIYDAHVSAIQRARGLIYMESQYFRDEHLTRALCRAAKAQPTLALILILPGAPEELAFEGRDGLDSQMGEWHQARCLRHLRRAFGARLFIGGAAQRRRMRDRVRGKRDHLAQAPLIYIHAKVSCFEDVAIISSANLNGRSMRWDTEAGVLLDDPLTVAHVRRRCMAHWLPPLADESFFDPATAVAQWRGLALSNAARAPERRQGFVVPYDLRAAERFGRPVPFLPQEMV